jgi:hypothetical protein
MNKHSFSIIYITGRGHSGSTILDLLLGNSENIESVGELLSGMGRPDDDCSCGYKIASCPFWSEVRKNTMEKFNDKINWNEIVELSHYFGHITRLPLLIFGVRRDKERICQQYTYSLFEVIAEISKKRIIVDSSKEITRGYFLVKNFSNVKLIHLIRNGEEILASQLYRMKERGSYRFLRRNLPAKYFHGLFMFLTTVTWVIGNLIIEIIRLFNRDKLLRVRYEDLCSSPDDELRRIGKFMNCEMESVIEKIKNRQKISIGHNIAGNKIRFSSSVIFEPKNRTI